MCTKSKNYSFLIFVKKYEKIGLYIYILKQKNMWVEQRGPEDTIECEINGETMEVWGVDAFDPSTSDETICAITEDAITQEENERRQEQEEIDRLIESWDFRG